MSILCDTCIKAGRFCITAHASYMVDGAACVYFSPLPKAPIMFTASDGNPIKMQGGALSTQIDGDHYKKMAIQPIEFCQKNQLNFCESNVVKYVCRHRNKNGVRDIKKAIHNLELLLEMEYGEK